MKRLIVTLLLFAAVCFAQPAVHSVTLTITNGPGNLSTDTFNVYKASGACPATGTPTFTLLIALGSGVSTYTDTTVSSGLTYCYAATAVQGGLESAYSPFFNAPIPGPTAPGLNGVIK